MSNLWRVAFQPSRAVARPGTLSRTTSDGISAIWVQKPVDQPIQVGFPASSVRGQLGLSKVKQFSQNRKSRPLFLNHVSVEVAFQPSRRALPMIDDRQLS